MSKEISTTERPNWPNLLATAEPILHSTLMIGDQWMVSKQFTNGSPTGFKLGEKDSQLRAGLLLVVPIIQVTAW